MQQDVALGHRGPGAFEAAEPAQSPPPPMPLPIKIEKELGLTPKAILWVVPNILFFEILPLLVSHGPIVDTLLHTSAGLIDGAIIAVVVGVCLMARNRGELDIDSEGVRVKSWRESWFYDWADVDRVVETTTGVRVLLKGRSDGQNADNLITSAFGLKPRQLYAVITDGAARFGAGRASPSGRTVCPGDDPRRAVSSPRKRLLLMMSALFGGLFAAIVVWQVSDCLKTLDLQKNGRRIEANVVRIYESQCGKRSCSINVEYTFVPDRTHGPSRTSYRGYAYIASSDHPNDQDLAYARTQATVPIVYDVNKPSVSKLNFRNVVFLMNPVRVMFQIIGLVGGIFVVVVGVFMTPVILMGRQGRR